MAAEFESHLGVFLEATDRAVKAGLIAAAEMYVTDMKNRLRNGYTSGDFVTGNNVNHVERGEPTPTGGGWTIPVGSTQTDPPYPLYWELGHINIFVKSGSVMGGYVRIPHWEPQMLEGRERYVGAVVAEIKAVDGAL